MKARGNLYQDASGNSIAGRYIYYNKYKNKYTANMKYPEGYCKSGTFYTFDEAVEWIEANWEKYLPGWYYDNDDRLVNMTIHRPLKTRMF